MELIIFVLKVVLGMIAAFGVFFVFCSILLLAQDADRRRTYGDEYADAVLDSFHKSSQSK